jgi:exodeoxyribonuclease VII small subunit
MTKLNFESALEQLEKIVETLESGELSLEQSLKRFEEGIKLSQYCTRKLEETEKKISLILEKSDGSLAETPWDNQDEQPSNNKSNESS